MDERLAAQLDLDRIGDEEFVERAFRLLLRRPPDSEARANALESIRNHELSRQTLLSELARSDEFRRLRVLDDAVVRGAAARATGEYPHELTASPTLDERPIEIAWTLGRYRGEKRVLDVGYAYAEPVWLGALLELHIPNLVGVDLTERNVPQMQTVVADLRRLPFPSRSFDVVFCVSTLEHVGADNTRYGVDEQADPEGPRLALRELRRVTARRGRILLTVPTGERPDADWYVAQDADAWYALFRDADLHIHDAEGYVRTPQGWRPGRADGEGVLCAELHPGRFRHELVRRLRVRRRK
jgi:O-antigen chain-terminating methyltransferase